MWKKLLIGVGVTALVFFVTVGALLFVTFKDLLPLEDGREVGPATTVVDSYVAAYLFDAGDGKVALVDATTSSDGAELLAALSAAGREPADVTHVLLTHGHPDHIAAVDLFPEATVYAHPADVGLVGGERVDAQVEDGDELEIGPHQVRVFHVPGHTQGSVAYLVDDTLFMGDAASATKQGELQNAPWIFSDDTAQAARSLVALSDRLAAEGYDVGDIAFGHSGPAEGTQSLKALADRLRD